MSDAAAKHWIQTYSGQQFFPLEPDFSACPILDQAHALSMLCRFGGHVRRFYSVAEHSVRVSRLAARFAKEAGLEPEKILYIAKWGLIHDNSEGCGFVDIPRPLKVQLPEYKKLEKQMGGRIAVWLGLGPEEPELVANADSYILGTEARQLKSPVHEEWHRSTASGQLSPEIAGVSLGWTQARAKSAYLREFDRLFGTGYD